MEKKHVNNGINGWFCRSEGCIMELEIPGIKRSLNSPRKVLAEGIPAYIYSM